MENSVLLVRAAVSLLVVVSGQHHARLMQEFLPNVHSQLLHRRERMSVYRRLGGGRAVGDGPRVRGRPIFKLVLARQLLFRLHL
jgi:hypothetical protein